MPPEQADPTSTLGPTADVYSLGAILYELLCGRQPFREATILATLDAVRSRPPVPPSRLVDAESLNPVATFRVPPDELIESIGFSGDGRYLVSGGGDQDRTHVWDLAVIRDQLRRYGLDWDAHRSPRLPVTVPAPIRVELDLAGLVDPASRPKW